MRFSRWLMTIGVILSFSFSTHATEPTEFSGITATHNKIRADLGLPSLRWSTQLAEYAQVWAKKLAKSNRCNMQHRPRNGTFAQQYGENLYWGSATRWSNGAVEIQNVSPAHVVNSWASEVKDYNYASNQCNPKKQCGHYTQIVWKNTSEVGCAKTICNNSAQIWVCNYHPAGNYIGEKPY